MNFIHTFQEALASDWPAALQRDEWFFARRRDDLVAGLNPSEAFAAIDEAATLLQQQSDPFLRGECGALLLSLARHADTTEMPSVLRSNWSAVMTGLQDVPQIAVQLR